LLQERDKVAQLEHRLADMQEKLGTEKVQRALAEDRLKSSEGYRTLRELAIVAGVAALGFSIEHWGLGAPAYLLAFVGTILLAAVVFSRWIGK
jgi:hypothetical protein